MGDSNEFLSLIEKEGSDSRKSEEFAKDDPNEAIDWDESGEIDDDARVELALVGKMDSEAKVGIDKSIRLRVMVDVRRPLIKHVKLKLRGGIEEFFEVKYEKTPLFCYFCGLMGHGIKDCDEHKECDNPTIPFGEWMKASPWKYRPGIRGENGGEAGKSSAGALFVTKPKTSEQRANEHEEWRFMVIYGHPEEENKYKTGQLLESLRDTNEKSWLVEGDLNLMLHSHEKRGGRGFCFEVADILRKAVDRCQLEDLGFIGHEFTWTNNQGGPKNIQERLDRFLANHAWREVFMGSFEMWLRDENCAEIVSEAWERGGDLCSKIAFTSSRLSAWSREKFGDFVKELNDC
uniref:CCHC-type domain-containing protein n=1 Tax=Chenopodium quinoa TaxID=63459 RepID=A0A803LLP6_CHEQI